MRHAVIGDMGEENLKAEHEPAGAGRDPGGAAAARETADRQAHRAETRGSGRVNTAGTAARRVNRSVGRRGDRLPEEARRGQRAGARWIK